MTRGPRRDGHGPPSPAFAAASRPIRSLAARWTRREWAGRDVRTGVGAMRTRRTRQWLLVAVLILLALGGVLLLDRRDEPPMFSSVVARSRPEPTFPPSPAAGTARPEPGPTPPARPEPAPAPTAPPPSVASPRPEEDIGRRLFRESASWIARGASPGPVVKSFHLALDAKFDLEGTHSEGPMRLWLQTPNLYRQQMVMSGGRHTKVLNAEGLWTADHGSASVLTRTESEADLRQVRDDYERLGDLAMYMSLRGLEVRGVSFEFHGEKKPSGPFARGGEATWLKVVLKRPSRPDISLWLAHESDADGVFHATYPGVVRVAGDPLNDVATEDYIFARWEDQPTDPPRAFRFPRTIRALHQRPGQAPYEFLRAAVTDIHVDTGIEPSVFTRSTPWIAASR
jgi:hypothetical protein